MRFKRIWETRLTAETKMYLFRWLLTAIILIASASSSWTQSTTDLVIPNFWDPQERVVKPGLQGVQRMKFLTVTDFPPFSFIDRQKQLRGFHVDLARAICAELNLSNVCQIQAIPFEEIEQTLKSGGAEAALAGHAITAQSRQRFGFSRPYFKLPARFIAKPATGLSEPLARSLIDKTLGIVVDTAHAAYAKAFLGNTMLRQFDSLGSAMTALEKDEVSAVFADGLALSFWIQAKGENACCEFVGGPYLDETYFGRGLAVTLAPQETDLEIAVNYALRSINDKGIFGELYLRYFPISLY